MPSITIRFDWDGNPTEAQLEHTLRELSGHLRFNAIEDFSGDPEDLMGYDGALIDELTVDAIIDDGHGITAADRADFAADAIEEARAHARAEETPVSDE